MRVRVLVTPKQGVLDPSGRATQRALRELGYDAVSDVRTGQVIQLEIATSDADEARRLAGEMCEKLLANPVIESYEIELASDD
ncbi:MAG: phosphoribosylformylglycinamidine synthase subunit PurS [Deltaproteobacteria bacterium]|nr:phosphoribosylformylglycinamidine synthase subunit PurS [Deltaproteobacteria bacterium]MBW2413979.1 phosphoribosylformylglycinamidine synthase subunit PurS [Deltaproteobacteria bacterium]